VERISSRQNAIVRRFRALVQQRDEREPFVLLDGAHLVEEALASRVPIDVAAFSETAAEGPLGALVPRVVRAAGRAVVLADSVFPAASPVRHPSGVVAIAHLAPATFDDVLRDSPALVLVLDTVQDPGNLGAVIRAAEACGATGVIAGEGSADPYGWKALRGAMGSSLRLPVVAHAPIPDAVRRLKARGLRIFAAVPRDGIVLPECDLTGPSAILLGSEGTGLSSAILDACDQRLMIPMNPPVESLNVATASAIVLYEASRQRAHVAVR
jgi:TrmH family RNA methyltransferase